MTLATRREQIVRAALESIAHQCHDLKQAIAADGAKWQKLVIDGGMAANKWIVQDFADVLDMPVERPADVESTGRGAAMLAATGAGLYSSLRAARAMLPRRIEFQPLMESDEKQRRLDAWHKGLSFILGQNN